VTTAKQGLFGAFLAAGLLMAGSASADVSGFISGIMGDKAANADFLGSWSSQSGDIDHIVVSSGSSGTVRIQVFGRCEARICNWGALPARVRTDGPTSQTVLSLAADFNLGYALRHITLHKQPGKTLRFDMVTEFTDGSDRHDYENSGALSVTGASAEVPTVGTPAAAAVVGQPASQFDNAQPVVATTTQLTQDCLTIDTAHTYVAADNGNWKLRDFLHVVQNFGPYHVSANKGSAILSFYRFDEDCHVGRGRSNLAFYRASGEVPHQAMPGQDCIDVHPEKVEAVLRDDDWKVVEGARAIYNYGSDKDGAVKAAAIIKSLNFSRQCFFDRANLSASYWLSR